MRILLMPAPTGMGRHSVHSGANYPTALAQIAAQLEPGHDIRGYDPDIEPDYPQSLEKLLATFRPELVAIGFRIFDTTLSYEPHSYLPMLEEGLRIIRGVVPEACIVLGGSGFSFFAQPLMKRLVDVDVGFYLAGDRSFPAFVENPVPRRDLPGILYREASEIIFTGPPEKVPLDELAPPNFDYFPVEDYMEEDVTAIGLESKRGCKMKCVPCVYPFLMGDTTFQKSPERVVLEAEDLVRRGVRSFFFLDSIFNLPHAHAQGICNALRDAKLPIVWGAFLNAARFDEEQRDLFYEAGCRRYYFSFDGVSPQAMKNWKRPVKWEQQRKAIRLVKEKRDNYIHVSFLFGSPGETLADLAAFPGMCAFLASQGVFSMSLSYARIYPGTKLHEIAIEDGLVDANDQLLEPTFYAKYPSKLAGLGFHPFYKGVHAWSRLKTRISKRRR
jgi:anaerobic magnesium-protoporphyrin IX monomethyl ester cyclase